MEFYISWSHSDALFTDYFEDCNILVSAVPDNRRAIGRIKTRPRSLLLDSGSIYYARRSLRPPAPTVFQTQLDMISNLNFGTNIQMVHLDEPLIHKSTLVECYRAMERNLANAHEFLRLFQTHHLHPTIQPMGVIQGFNGPSVRYAARELMTMGYQSFGIGSLLAQHPDKQLDLIQEAATMVGLQPLHVFGVTGLAQMKEMIKLGITSFDSTRPTMAAVYAQVFYSNPFRTYLLADSRSTKTLSRLSEPLPCDCPVCLVNPKEMFTVGAGKFTKLRAVHNYYHLTKTLAHFAEQENQGGI